jgi:hypothetical protein
MAISDPPPSYPLLLFGRSVRVEREPLASGPGRPPRRLTPEEQQARLGTRWEALDRALGEKRAAISPDLGGTDPELVLVMEIVGSVPDFFRAVRRIEGFEFLAELDEEVDDEAFVDPTSEDDEGFDGTLYLLAANQRALDSVLALWRQYQQDETASFPYGQAKWKDLFRLLVDLRRWGPADRLRGTGAVEDFASRLAIGQDVVPAEVELWYRSDAAKRSAAEAAVRQAVDAARGSVLARATIESIAYHALLVRLPIAAIQPLFEGRLDDVALVRVEEIAFLRPEAQAAVSVPVPQQVDPPFKVAPVQVSDAPPMVAVLDGLPLARHLLLDDRLVIDDPDGWEPDIPAADRQHGTAVTSLVVHGDRNADGRSPSRRIYTRPVLKPDEGAAQRRECMPHDQLAIDLIHRAVVRLFDGPNAIAPEVRLINLSLGDAAAQLATTLSPWARLLDYLAYRYQVLFVVSAGNHLRPLTFSYPAHAVSSMSEPQLRLETLRRIVDEAALRRILSPSEAVSCLCIGASHDDASGQWPNDARRNFLPGAGAGTGALPSPISAAGMGYRRCIKPDLLAPGGRVLFRGRPAAASDPMTTFDPAPSVIPPGLTVAAPSPGPGGLAGVRYFHGTSGAAALVSHHGAIVLEHLSALMDEDGASVDSAAWSVLTKALLVHTSRLPPSASEVRQAFVDVPPRRIRDAVTRLYGYGVIDPSRLLECSPSRATALGWGKLDADEGMRFQFPLPPSLAGKVVRRRLVITAAYFPPIRPRDRRHRAAEVYFRPDNSLLRLSRADADWRTVKRGTVQHEVLVGDQAAAYVDGTVIAVQVNCRAIIEPMKESVPFGLAVTLEAEGDLPIYAEVAARIRAQARARAR